MRKTGQIKTPQERYEEAAIELAVYHLLQQEKQAAFDERNEALGRQADQRAGAAYAAMQRLIDKNVSRAHLRQAVRRHGVRALKAAAVLLLAFNLGLTVAVAASRQVRAFIIEFVTSTNASYMEVGFSQGTEALYVPEGWLSNYFPAYIPPGYEELQKMNGLGADVVFMMDQENHELIIQVLGTGASGNVNTEGARLSTIPLHGTTAQVIRQDDDRTDIIWSLGDKYFMVTSTESYETALAVAQSMAVIRK